MHSKQKYYLDLVEKRKNLTYPEGLINPSRVEGGRYDTSHLGPWTQWQGDLDAKILVVGKDWGDEKTFIIQKGVDLDHDRTNINLRLLFREIGIEIGLPSKPHPAPLFFTNAVLGLRTFGGKSGPLKSSWIKMDTQNFLKPIIDMIQPDIIISLGMDAYSALAYIYRLKKANLKDLITKNPIILSDRKLLFALYHCGQLATNRIRNLELQKEDWKIIKNFL